MKMRTSEEKQLRSKCNTICSKADHYNVVNEIRGHYNGYEVKEEFELNFNFYEVEEKPKKKKKNQQQVSGKGY